ncbi:hypothetical protein NPX13_g3139 [Xylaria arbuscula]|uniref:Uncharacterized protein n=1 Tax=Xylaria arbuscula TaxID=114810 RepID=A0A9W8NIB3_9PEZI|nr:hypothetical protein NPX13_g3139 [Xylaria arbuscula]
MPAKATNGVDSTQPTATSRLFELPALDLKFGSLTDGTDIPPPLPSPKEEEEMPPPPPKVVAKEEKKEKVEAQQPKVEANGTTNGTSPRKPDITVQTKVGVKRTADEVPLSPALSSRGSLRRLISKTFLNHAYDEQGSPTGHNTSRPPSRTASVLAEEKKAKRSSGWFRRLRSHDTPSDDNKPAHSQFESLNKKPTGPPPPMIPELSALETKVDTHLGDDLFKGIGRDL